VVTDLSDREVEALYLKACAEHFQWRVDRASVEADRLIIEGWAITLSGRPEDAQFLINGAPFEEVHYPEPSPDLAEIFWNIPTARTARFVCGTSVNSEHTYHTGFARLEFQDGSDSKSVRRRAWYLPGTKDDLPVPETFRIRRVIGEPASLSYLIGGATIYKRLENYLQEQCGKNFDDFPEVLDWACGCGRVARNFRWASRTKIYGVDIDADNIAWCQQHLPHGQFIATPVLPPLPFPDGSFDLILAVSILNQLSAEHQSVWLRELKRVARPGALLMLSSAGLTQIGLARPHPSLVREVEEKGFVVTGRNCDLDDVMPDQMSYLRGLHSRDYLRRTLEQRFTVIDVVDSIVANDDLFFMKNDNPPSPQNPFSLPLRDYDINPFIHPTMGKSGYAGHLIDAKGIDYIDFMSAWGTNLLGYGYRKVARAAARQAKQFSGLGIPYPQFYELRELLCSIIPTAEDVRYGKNGSDACAGAVRLTRFLTGREKILYHGYHGFHDWYFASTDCPGIPLALKETVISQGDLTPEAVDAAFRKHPNEIAGLIINPLTAPAPTAEEMCETIEVVHRHGGLVIFDEMLSGFRVAPGGMQELWGVKPDISCFGKSIANGFPLSVLCGPGEYIRRLPETYYGMTFEGEAVSIAAAYATLTEVVKKNVVGELYEKGRTIRAEYKRLAAAYSLSTSLDGYEPCMSLDFQQHGAVSGRELLWLMIQELVRHRVFTLGAFILCFSHSQRDLRKLGRAFDAAMSVLHKAVDCGSTEGLLDERIRQRMDHIAAPANWRRATEG